MSRHWRADPIAAGIGLDAGSAHGMPRIPRIVCVLLAVSAAAWAQFTASPGSPFTSVSGPGSVAVGDFNGDGRPDLAIANANSNNVTVLLGNGAGGFTAAAGSPFPAGQMPMFVAVGDFNGDGRPDLAIANHDGHVTVLLGNGSGGFTAAAGSPFAAGAWPASIAVADFNADGNLDLAIANANSNNVTVLLGNGSGGFTAAPGSPFPAGSGPQSVAVGDFNGDGKPDLAIANGTGGNVTVLLGNGAGGFTAAAGSPFAAGSGPQSVAVGDFNGDGKPDIAIANGNSNNVTVLLGNGAGRFTAAPGSPFPADTPRSIAAADFNRDGKPDLAITNWSGTVTVLLGDGTGGFAAAPGSPYPAGLDPESVAVGDFNGDGKPDLAMADFFGSTVTVLLNAFPPIGWQLAWSDEFNQAAGTPPDPTKWNFDLGGGGWGNAELENYTNSTANAFQDGNGNLVIRAIRDSNGNYTSARLQTGSPGASTHTADGNWQYGLIESRIKLPFGHGVWPAFWMLGENIGSAGWPTCGEVDIMENFGFYGSVNDAATNNGTAHGPGYSGANGISKSYTLPLGEQVADDFHLYAIQWSANAVAFYVDGALYSTVTPGSLPPGAQWVYNAPFFILLNLAIGGPNTFLGTPDSGAPFSNQDMLVDYVRVYQAAAVDANAPVISPAGVLNAASYLGAIAPGSLVSLFGNNLADGSYQGSQVLDASGHFVTSVAGVSVAVNDVNAPLAYVGPGQINFQIPWETAPGPAVRVQVTRAGVTSAVEQITIASTASPSMFLNDYSTGVAWVTGTVDEGCAITQCVVQAGGYYQLWANGLGPKSLPEQDGVGDAAPTLDDLSVVGGTASCQLTIGGIPAEVTYCGAAPGEIIDQLNFKYPAGMATGSPYVSATLTINGVTGHFRLPAPAAQ
jgi:uncharacterized protein (TIGR03437 family)